MRIDYTKPNVKSILLSIWQLPQIVVAAFVILFAFIFARNREWIPFPNGTLRILELRLNFKLRQGFCFTLGPFIFTPFRVHDDTLLHESGHSVQSMILGPFYLFAVAIPSICLALYRKAKHKDAEWYHAHYPENWADKLGGLK